MLLGGWVDLNMDDVYIVFGKAYLFLIAYKTIFILTILVIAIFLISSFRHHRKVTDYLYQKIPFSKDDLKKLKPKIGAMEMTISGVALFDVLYHLSKVNPLLLSGAYRLHHKSQQFESYADISEFLKHQYALDAGGAVSKYKGYVGEEHTIGQQIESGADITVPDSGTNPGYDFIIDGQKYDRKVVGDSNLNQEIKGLKDDEKLWVDTESGRDYLDNDKVYVDPNSLSEGALVNITIYDMMGRVVKTMVNSQQNAGFKSVRWNATNDKGSPVSAGLYLYTIQAGEFRQTKKMVLLK